MPKCVKMMMLDACPHCKNALEIIENLKKQHPEYCDVVVEVIEENREPEKTTGYDYWYVPTFFVEDEKIHEGVPTQAKVESVFRAALK